MQAKAYVADVVRLRAGCRIHRTYPWCQILTGISLLVSCGAASSIQSARGLGSCWLRRLGSIVHVVPKARSLEFGCAGRTCRGEWAGWQHSAALRSVGREAEENFLRTAAHGFQPSIMDSPFRYVKTRSTSWQGEPRRRHAAAVVNLPRETSRDSLELRHSKGPERPKHIKTHRF